MIPFYLLEEEMKIKITIIGSGPAAWTAAIYAARADLKPVVYTGKFKGGTRGGQLMLTTEVENFPGFAEGVMGPELVKVMEEQARRFGTQVIEEDVIEVNLGVKPYLVKGTETTLETDALIVATGAYAKRLDIPGDKEFWGRGVSACAVCDGALPLFRNKDLVVVGGGDTACEEALFLTKFAKKVSIILRRDEFRASKIMVDRVSQHPKIEIIYNNNVVEIFGQQMIQGVVLQNSKTGEKMKLETGGLFYGIGHAPNVDFLKNQVATDEDGYLIVKKGSSFTSVEGVFAAGDVADKVYRQAITAAGTGCIAALDCERWLASKEHNSENILLKSI